MRTTQKSVWTPIKKLMQVGREGSKKNREGHVEGEGHNLFLEYDIT